MRDVDNCMDYEGNSGDKSHMNIQRTQCVKLVENQRASQQRTKEHKSIYSKRRQSNGVRNVIWV